MIRKSVLNNKYLFFVIILFVLSLSIVIINYYSNQQGIVTTKELETYIIEYFSMYTNLVETNMNLFIVSNGNLTNIMPEDMFYRYNHYPSEIEGVISKEHGCAVIYSYNEIMSSIKIKTVAESIEYYIWPNMNKKLNELKSFAILPGEYVLDNTINVYGSLLVVRPNSKIISTVSTGMNAFNVSNTGAILIHGELIIEDTLILKGNNNRIFWSRPQSDLDALSQFLFDCRDVLNSTTIKSLENKYKSTFLLDKISYCIKTEFYKENPNFFYEHFDELKQTGFSNEIIISKIWENYDEQQRYIEPTILEKIYTNELIRGLILVGVSSFISYKLGERKAKKEVNKA